MRVILACLCFAAAACAPADEAAHAEASWAQCDSMAAPEIRIAACSGVIADEAAPAARRAAAYVIRGSIRANLGQHARAVADFGRALRLDARNAHAYLERGLVHHNRGAFDTAVRDYDAALALDPQLQLALERRQAALDGRVDAIREQIAALGEALDREPENAQLLNERCWIRAINGDDLDAALADCDAALRIEPAFAAALDSRGLVHLKRGAYQAALADYEAALAVEPGRGHFLYGRGLARLRLGMTSEGAADLIAAEQAEAGVADLYESYGAAPS